MIFQWASCLVGRTWDPWYIVQLFSDNQPTVTDVDLGWQINRSELILNLAWSGIWTHSLWKGKNLVPRFICWPFSTQVRYKNDLLRSIVASSQWKPSEKDSMMCIWNLLRSSSSSWQFWVILLLSGHKEEYWRPSHGDYQERPSTKSFETQSWAGPTTAKTPSD